MASGPGAPFSAACAEARMVSAAKSALSFSAFRVSSGPGERKGRPMKKTPSPHRFVSSLYPPPLGGSLDGRAREHRRRKAAGSFNGNIHVDCKQYESTLV